MEMGPLLPDLAQLPNTATTAGVGPQGRWLCVQVTHSMTGHQVLFGSEVWTSYLCVYHSTALHSHINWGIIKFFFIESFPQRTLYVSPFIYPSGRDRMKGQNR